MAQVIQVEIKTGTTHTITWLDAALKVKPGMALVCKGDALVVRRTHIPSHGARSEGLGRRLEGSRL
jgi:hypothetical protein